VKYYNLYPYIYIYSNEFCDLFLPIYRVSLYQTKNQKRSVISYRRRLSTFGRFQNNLESIKLHGRFDL